MFSSKRHILVASDFDGTISTHDTGTTIIDSCMGKSQRQLLDQEIIAGTRTFRDAVAEMWGSVRMGLDQAQNLLSDIKLDDQFEHFVAKCDQHEIPLIVLSSGLDFLIRPMLQQSLGLRAESLRTIVNRGEIDAQGQWAIHYLDDSPYGHDKTRSIQLCIDEFGLMKETFVVYIGDGVSDIPCAHQCHCLYAKRGKDLHLYCIKNGLKHRVFDTFADVISDMHTWNAFE